MSLYSLLKIHEQLYYVSIVAELANIFYFVSIILGIDLPHGFNIGLQIYNLIYAAYMLFIIFFTEGLFKRCAFIILTLAIFKDLIWGKIPIISIIDSLVCIGVLAYYHQFLYAIMEKIENEGKEGEEV